MEHHAHLLQRRWHTQMPLTLRSQTLRSTDRMRIQPTLSRWDCRCPRRTAGSHRDHPTTRALATGGRPAGFLATDKASPDQLRIPGNSIADGAATSFSGMLDVHAGWTSIRTLLTMCRTTADTHATPQTQNQTDAHTAAAAAMAAYQPARAAPADSLANTYRPTRQRGSDANLDPCRRNTTQSAPRE